MSSAYNVAVSKANGNVLFKIIFLRYYGKWLVLLNCVQKYQCNQYIKLPENNCQYSKK